MDAHRLRQPPSRRFRLTVSIAKNGHISSTSVPLSRCDTNLWQIYRKLRGQSGDFRQKLTANSQPRDHGAVAAVDGWLARRPDDTTRLSAGPAATPGIVKKIEPAVEIRARRTTVL